MLTYESYMQRKLELDGQMHETRTRESDRVKGIEEERQQRNSQLFEEYLEKKRSNNHDYADRIRDARQEFIDERRRIFERSNILTMQWRAQLLKLEKGEVTSEQVYGVTPPHYRWAA